MGKTSSERPRVLTLPVLGAASREDASIGDTPADDDPAAATPRPIRQSEGGHSHQLGAQSVAFPSAARSDRPVPVRSSCHSVLCSAPTRRSHAAWR